MKDINIKEIMDLATQDITNPEAELKRVYEWHCERKTMIIKGSIGVAISFLVSLAISSYEKSTLTFNWLVLVAVLSSILSMTYGFFELYRLRRIGRKYIAAIMLLNRFKNIEPFLSLYRNILRRM